MMFGFYKISGGESIHSAVAWKSRLLLLFLFLEPDDLPFRPVENTKRYTHKP
jgi:hypothetical protein